MNGYTVRQAEERDLDVIADFEVEIARISFGDDAVDDPATHRKKLANALKKQPEGMFVAARGDEAPVGWLWMALNTNFLTGDRYANFRSLAVAELPERTEVAELLLDEGLAFAKRNDLTEVTGKVHVSNTGMRTLYRKFGFESTHLSMRLDMRK